jgi:hypothetical protein
MPNFVADEIALRSRQAKNSRKWGRAERIESGVVFRGTNAIRQQVRIDGKPWHSQSSWLPGPNWGIGFGADLQPPFERDCANEFTSEGVTDVRGKQVLINGFRAPMEGCFGPGTNTYNTHPSKPDASWCTKRREALSKWNANSTGDQRIPAAMIDSLFAGAM